MEFIEAPLFTKLVPDYFESDHEYSDFQGYLKENPESGDLIPGSGGLRKVRWAAKGKGKRGGIRIIYYYKSRDGAIWLLTVYAKNELVDIPKHVLRKIKEEIEK